MEQRILAVMRESAIEIHTGPKAGFSAACRAWGSVWESILKLLSCQILEISEGRVDSALQCVPR